MKNILIILIAILLLGCNNSVKNAKANAIHQATNRTNDKHNLAMADSHALTPTRLIVKEILLWTLMTSGIIVTLGGGFAFTYFLVGAAVYTIRDMKTQQIPLATATRQYPLLIYRNGSRAYNPNTGERLLLSETSEAPLPRLEASTKVQLAGLLSDNSKIINGVTNGKT